MKPTDTENWKDRQRAEWKIYKEELLQDPKVRDEYDKLQPEFEAKRKTLRRNRNGR